PFPRLLKFRGNARGSTISPPARWESAMWTTQAINSYARMPATARQRGKVAPVKLAHVLLRTTPDRVGLVADWYKTVLEGESMFENEHIAFITYDGEHHRVAIAGMRGVKPHVDKHAGLHHVAFTYAGLGDLLHTYERLKERGITPLFCI